MNITSISIPYQCQWGGDLDVLCAQTAACEDLAPATLIFLQMQGAVLRCWSLCAPAASVGAAPSPEAVAVSSSSSSFLLDMDASGQKGQAKEL